MPTITKLDVYNNSGSTISTNKIVYISGFNRNLEVPTISLADNSDEDTMPAIGIAIEDIPNNTSSKILTTGYIFGIDLRRQRSSSRVYVGTNGDFAYENPQDDNADAFYQVIGVIVDKSRNGRILIAPITEAAPAPPAPAATTATGILAL